MRHAMVGLVLALLLGMMGNACSAPPQVVRETVMVRETVLIEVTRIVEREVYRVVTATPRPAATSVHTPEPRVGASDGGRPTPTALRSEHSAAQETRDATQDLATPTATHTPTIQPTTTLPPTQRPPECLTAAQAGSHVGDVVCVEFQVVRTFNSGKVVFLNSHDPYQGHFYVAIFPDNWDCWDPSPEDYFQNQVVRVRGEVEMYEGAPEIIVNRCDQIEIVP